LAFLFEEINSLKKQLNTKIPISKKRKTESILSTEISLTTTSDEDEEYFPFFSSLTRIKSNKLANISHPTSELVVNLNVNNEEQLLRALTDTGASSSIILEGYTSKNLIQSDKSNQTTWSTIGGQFTTDKTGLVTFSLPEFNLKKQVSWKFHVDDSSKSSSTYDMIIGRDLLGELGIILNFNDHTLTWDTDTIPMKDKGTLNTQDALLEVYLLQMNQKVL
jgi:Aspartyl protease